MRERIHSRPETLPPLRLGVVPLAILPLPLSPHVHISKTIVEPPSTRPSRPARLFPRKHLRAPLRDRPTVSRGGVLMHDRLGARGEGRACRHWRSVVAVTPLTLDGTGLVAGRSAQLGLATELVVHEQRRRRRHLGGRFPPPSCGRALAGHLLLVGVDVGLRWVVLFFFFLATLPFERGKSG